MDATPWVLAAVAGAGAIGAARLATALTRRHRRRKALAIPASVDDPTRGRPRPWIIMNPSKHEDPQAFKELINRKAKELGITHVHWRETTREDPGTGQAVRALEEGASVVIAAGGDGTVRAVAAGMAGSGVRMGIIPVGTGNVLAGNLSVPDDPEEALAVALDRNHRAVDLAWVRIEDVTQESTQPAEGGLRLAARTALHPEASAADQGAPASSNEPRADEYACLVVAGMGYDGATMADTNPELKKRIGWIAYVWAGLGAMGVPRMKARLTLRSPAARVADPLGVGDQITGEALDEDSSASAEPLRSPADEITRVEARSVMFANAGELKMLVLAPDAELSDGLIDVIAVDARRPARLGGRDLEDARPAHRPTPDQPARLDRQGRVPPGEGRVRHGRRGPGVPGGRRRDRPRPHHAHSHAGGRPRHRSARGAHVDGAAARLSATHNPQNSHALITRGLAHTYHHMLRTYYASARPRSEARLKGYTSIAAISPSPHYSHKCQLMSGPAHSKMPNSERDPPFQ